MYERISRPSDRSINAPVLFRTEGACDGHHVNACRSSARRHRQGPKAARMRGRSEAQRLARCRAQMQHRCRDGRRVDATPEVFTSRRPQVDIEYDARQLRFSGRATDLEAPANATSLRATFSGRTGLDLPDNLSRNRARSMRQTRGASRRRACLSDSLSDSDSHGVSDPSGQARDR